MPRDLSRENLPVGELVFDWEVPEYEKYERTKRWYLIMGVVGVSLIVYSIVSTNYLFALVIILFCIVTYLHEAQEPLAIRFAVTTTGIILGRKYYRYSELKDFWIIYEPGEVKNLYFTLNNAVKHRLQVPLLDNDPVAIREELKKFLKEDLMQEEEPFSDRLSRILQLH
jgi:hypothetical protein